MMSSVGVLVVTIVYVVLCGAVMAWFRKTQSNYNLVLHGLVPLIGLVIFAFGVYGSIYSGAFPPMPFRIIPYVNLGWIIVGLVVIASLRSRHPERVAQIGSILGEEGGEEAAVLDR